MTLGDTALRHVQYLSDTVGPRPVGSAANQRAAAYLQAELARLGGAVTTQCLEVPNWEPVATTLEGGGRSWPAAASLFSPDCAVTAPAVAVCTLAELRAAELAGRIALLHGELCAGTGLSARRGIYFPERDGQIMDLLEAKRPAAVLAVHSRPGSVETLFHDWLFPLPSATVPAEAGRALLEITTPLRLHITARRGPARSLNVIGRWPGARPERVVCLAHVDSVNAAPGAGDNAAGVGCLLAAAEALAARRERPVGVELLAVNGEEVGGPGDVTYLEQVGEAGLADILAVINVDGVGGAVGCHTLMTLGASTELQARVAEVGARFPGVAPVEPWYASDHTAFAMRGVPAVAVSSQGVSELMHTPADTAAWLSPAKLDEVAQLVLALWEALADFSPAAARPPAA